MLNKTLEFLRIVDVQPSHEKVQRRTEAASELVAQLTNKENNFILLDCLQGIVAGFDGSLFTQESPTIQLLIKIIKDRDATLPHDLKENAIELRVIAGIAVGELLTSHSNKPPTEEKILAALSLRSALSSQPSNSKKYIRWMLETLLTISDKVLYSASHLRRNCRTPALERLSKLKKTTEETTEESDMWDLFLPSIISALQEVNNQRAIDREEVETLWWMFTAYSEIEQKPLADLSPLAAAFCAGIELAQRSLLPPSPSGVAMIKRVVESGRKAEILSSVSLQDATVDWSESMINNLSPVDGKLYDIVSRYPALLPISWACNQLRECKRSRKLGREFTELTGRPVNHSESPANWGAQVFREKILQRVIEGN